MKNGSTYIASVIVSVLLVFCLLGSSAAVIANSCVNEKQFKSIVSRVNADEKVCSELERYFKERSSATGIPADVYMSAIDTEYISSVIDQRIENGFHALRGGNQSADPKNDELEASIEKFFSDYADSISYEKDAKYEKKLAATQKSAYSIIGEYSDVYKFGALDSHGVLRKASRIYTKLDVIMIASIAVSVLLIAVLFILNLGTKSATLYWSGVSALIAGLIGLIPCAYLLATDYFSSFTIKQPQIFAVYTETLTVLTKTFMFASIGIAAAGLLLVIVYIIVKPRCKAETAA